MSSPNYSAICRGVNGTKAVYRYLGAYSEPTARIAASKRWEWEHPGEQLAMILIDCVEDSYERREEREYV